MSNIMKVVKRISNSQIIVIDGGGKKKTLFGGTDIKVGDAILVVNGIVVKVKVRKQSSIVYNV